MANELFLLSKIIYISGTVGKELLRESGSEMKMPSSIPTKNLLVSSLDFIENVVAF